ncbi:MAG: glycoside hydrolase family 65 protein [Halanaerobiaceae bacterium]
MRKFHKKKLEKQPLYEYEPWKITEKEFKVENNHKNESIFSIGNGYLGVRGTFEEDYSGPESTTTPGIYINGVYASECILYGEKAPKQPEYSQTIINLADWTKINLYINGEKFDMLTGEIVDYLRFLDMKEGTLNRQIIWKSPEGRKVEIKTRRFISMTSKHLGLIKYQVKPLNFSGEITISSAIQGDVRNKYHLRNPQALSIIERGFSEDKKKVYLKQLVGSTDIMLAIAVINDIKFENKNGERQECRDSLVLSLIEEECLIQEFKKELQEGQSMILTKYVSIYDSRDATKQKLDIDGNQDLLEYALDKIEKYGKKNFDWHLKKHSEYLDAYWQNTDVKIEGDISLQQGFRYNALQLLHSTGRDEHTNVPAKGLTGEHYEGHYFWDTETYVIPFFLYNNPEIARSLLMYRYNILDKARENARRVRLEGALFPWRTINGDEASAFFMGSTVQFHINADIAYAIHQYYHATEDKDFLYNYGVEILIETARMWASRGCYIPFLDDKYCFNEVCGPDEYKPGVSNNAYTNYMAQFNLEYAIEIVEMLSEEEPELYRELAERLNFDRTEILKWRTLVKDIYLPYNEEMGVLPQDDSFLFKDEIDIDALDDTEFPLVSNWHPLTIWRFQVIKQADVILLMFLLGEKFTLEEKKANYDYYEPKTTHDSSLSSSIYSIIAAEIGYYNEAYNYFIQTVRLDLDDFNENTWQGLHIAAMGSAWLSLVQGFAGMRNYNGKLHFLPYLPDEWESYEFKIVFKGNQLKIRVEKEKVYYNLINGSGLKIYHNGLEIEITPEQPDKTI